MKRLKDTFFAMTARLMLAMLLTALSPTPAAETGNEKCPIMTDEDADADIKVGYQDTFIHFCCSPCVKQFKKEPDYYVALFQAMKSVPSVQNIKVPDGIRLLEQRFCPFSSTRLIGPASPAVEYKGVKIYLSKPGHVTAWNEAPEKHAREGFAKGLLPQLKGKL
jgi:YHS domain-containing protein